MKLLEILQGLRDGKFHLGEELKCEEGLWFKITDDGKLLGEIDGEIFEIGELTTLPLPFTDNS